MEILNNINRIVAYGCSYTAGDELLDHEILGMSFDNCNKFKKQFATVLDFNDYSLNGQTIFKLIQHDARNRGVSWAGQLAKLSSKTFENRAIGGSSIEEHYYSIVRDLSNNQIVQTDLVLVGLTIPDRIFIYPTGSDKPHSKLLSNTWQWSDPKLKEYAVNYFFTDFSIILNYYKTLKLLSTLSTKINIRVQPMRPSVIPGHNFFKYKSDILELNNYVNTVWHDCQSIFIDSDYNSTLTENSGDLCGFGHQNVQSHINLAEKLLKNL
jgi:hypothetical protein